VVTGNLDIVQDKELRNLLGMGAKYRETPKQNFKTLFKNITKSFEYFIIKWARQAKVETDMLKLWQDNILKEIKKRIQIYKHNYKHKENAYPIIRNRRYQK
jgi:ElaB/YqjD/DUF883 family membrane-anchored ribosome-binding protein